MKNKEMLKQEIEELRQKLDQALESGASQDKYYKLSVQLDKLIEQYLDWEE